MRKNEKSEDKEEVSLPTSPPQSSVFQPSGTTGTPIFLFFCQLRKSKSTTQRLPSANLVSITGITGVVLITLSS